MNYFELLNVPPVFDLDAQALEAAYLQQQRLYHPDRFVRKSPQERQEALLRSVEINAAWETLKKPLSRAQYLLHLQGIEVGTERDTVRPSPALLMETMEWREQIDEINPEGIQPLHQSLKHLEAQLMQEISGSFSASAWEAMAQQVLRLGYILKSLEALALKGKHIKVAL